MMGSIDSLQKSADYEFSKQRHQQLELIAGVGVAGDVHAGAQVRHRSRVAADPTQPNLRQVHLIHAELFDDLASAGFEVKPGDLGENITTAGIDLLGLPVGAVLSVGDDAILAVTGLRNPCGQIDNFQAGLLAQVRRPSDDGPTEKLSGVMAVVVRGGVIRVGDTISVGLPTGAHHSLVRV